MVQQAFAGIEAEAQVRKAMKDWREKFVNNAEKIDGLGGTVFWHARLAMWGHFDKWQRNDGSDRYWNPFGFSPIRFRQNMIVEINPPSSGFDKGRGLQGVLARAHDGSRWVLHKGRMSIRGAHVSEAQFDAASVSKRVPVHFSDGSVILCHPVCNIDGTAKALQDQIAVFVAECRRIRLHYLFGPQVARQEAAVEAAERGSPELTDSYQVSAQDARVAFRQHGDVWHALVEVLNKIGVSHTNSRVGRWGPDLRTLGGNPVLFEIKISTTASDVQRAVGQLFLYEQLLRLAHKKVLILPGPLETDLGAAIRRLGLSVLFYSRKSKLVNFDSKQLRQLT